MNDAMMATCPACGRSLGLADRNGLHVADEAHYPRRDEGGAMDCAWLARPSGASSNPAEDPEQGDPADGVLGLQVGAPALGVTPQSSRACQVRSLVGDRHRSRG
jgi:hypothetical protein